MTVNLKVKDRACFRGVYKDRYILQTYIYRQKDRQIILHTYIYRQKDRQIDGQIDRQKDRWIHITYIHLQIERQIDRQMSVQIECNKLSMQMNR